MVLKILTSVEFAKEKEKLQVDSNGSTFNMTIPSQATIVEGVTTIRKE